jgi:hypothetical protein
MCSADLPGAGGLDILADVLLEEGRVRVQALKVLQTAASNNIKFQLKLLEQEAAVVPWLLQVWSPNLLCFQVFGMSEVGHQAFSGTTALNVLNVWGSCLLAHFSLMKAE